MKNTSNMNNGEFMEHLMTGYSQYGALVQMVILDCLQKGLDQYIESKDEILAQEEAEREAGKVSFINMTSWIGCCEETKERIQNKYT